MTGTATQAPRTLDGIEIPAQGTWKFDQTHTHFGFVARHLMVTKVRGSFKEFDGTIHIGQGLEDSWVEASVKTQSVDTGVEMRDNHLRSADFFDYEKYPEITFKSTSAERTGKTSFALTGDLAVGAITKPITFDVEFDGLVLDHTGGYRAAFSAEAEINREDWGITWNVAIESGGFLVGPKVKLVVDLEAVPAT
ncbi:MAG: YceI family protein [Actinomycetota bacterium]|nr:YceI family protein [Actinomycetota bacterium]